MPKNLIELCYGHLLRAGGKETPRVACDGCVHDYTNRECLKYKPCWINYTGGRLLNLKVHFNKP